MTLEQQYRDNYSIFFIAGFLLLTLVKTSQLIASGFHFSIELLALISTIILLSGIIYVLTKSTLKVKFGKKKITVKIQPLGVHKVQFKKNEIEEINFIKTSTITKSNGMLVHFGNSDRVFNFGGNKVMIITLLDGRKFSFFSKELFEQQEEIISAVFATNQL